MVCEQNSDILRPMGGNFQKCVLACLFSTKYNEINMYHSSAQKYAQNINRFNFSCTGPHKKVMDTLCVGAKNGCRSIFS